MKIRVNVRGKDFEVEVEDLAARPVIAMINGERFEVWPDSERGTAWEEEKSALLASGRNILLPVKSTPNQVLSSISTVKIIAPIPGVILSIKVKEGDTVQVGDELCVLEAMKMKNILHAEHSATIKKIMIMVGDSVSHNQPLMEAEESELIE